FLAAEAAPTRAGVAEWNNRDEPATQPSAALCTPATARPDGSAAAAKAASHSIAAGDEQAIERPPGTVRAQASPGQASSNRRRYQYASFVDGGLTGNRAGAAASSASPTIRCACAFKPSIQP